MRQKLKQGGGIQRRPQQFTGQRQHLKDRPPRRQRAETEARAIHMLQRLIEQFAAGLGQHGDGLIRCLR